MGLENKVIVRCGKMRVKCKKKRRENLRKLTLILSTWRGAFSNVCSARRPVHYEAYLDNHERPTLRNDKNPVSLYFSSLGWLHLSCLHHLCKRCSLLILRSWVYPSGESQSIIVREDTRWLMHLLSRRCNRVLHHALHSESSKASFALCWQLYFNPLIYQILANIKPFFIIYTYIRNANLIASMENFIVHIILHISTSIDIYC